jgi:hypothetical protein
MVECSVDQLADRRRAESILSSVLTAWTAIPPTVPAEANPVGIPIFPPEAVALKAVYSALQSILVQNPELVRTVVERIMPYCWEALSITEDEGNWFFSPARKLASERNHRAHANILQEVFGNPFCSLPPRPAAIAPLAEDIYGGAWDRMPLLGEWLQEHGFWEEGGHCLDCCVPHVKGCWVVDWVTGRK